MLEALQRIEGKLIRIEQLIQSQTQFDAWLDLKSACKYSGLGESTIRREIMTGRLKVSKQVGKLMFRKIWIDRFLMFGRQRLTVGERKELEQL